MEWNMRTLLLSSFQESNIFLNYIFEAETKNLCPRDQILGLPTYSMICTFQNTNEPVFESLMEEYNN